MCRRKESVDNVGPEVEGIWVGRGMRDTPNGDMGTQGRVQTCLFIKGRWGF